MNWVALALLNDVNWESFSISALGEPSKSAVLLCGIPLYENTRNINILKMSSDGSFPMTCTGIDL